MVQWLTLSLAAPFVLSLAVTPPPCCMCPGWCGRTRACTPANLTWPLLLTWRCMLWKVSGGGGGVMVIIIIVVIIIIIVIFIIINSSINSNSSSNSSSSSSSSSSSGHNWEIPGFESRVGWRQNRFVLLNTVTFARVALNNNSNRTSVCVGKLANQAQAEGWESYPLMCVCVCVLFFFLSLNHFLPWFF